MKFLENNAPKEEFNKIHTLVLSVMSPNNEELVEVNGYVAIAANNEAKNYFYVVCFISFHYKLQEDME